MTTPFKTFLIKKIDVCDDVSSDKKALIKMWQTLIGGT